MEQIYDAIIIGGGPAGLAAGIYCGRAKLKTLILEKGTIGGRAYNTREIVNYPGLGDNSGPGISAAMEEQARGFNVEIKKANVISAKLDGDVKEIRTRKDSYLAKTIIIAAGTEARTLGIPGEKELTGKGVAYCATCDAEFFEEQEVVVVGSGDQAIEESMFIAKFASHVTIIVLHEEGVLDCNRVAAERAFSHSKLSFVWSSVLSEVSGREEVEGVKIKNLVTGEVTDLPCSGVFFFVGMIPSSGFFDGPFKDSRGWLHTSEQMETGIPGVFAAGDIRSKYLRQIATAVSDGAVAATSAERYLSELESLEQIIEESGGEVVLGFWSPELPGSIEALSELRDREMADKNEKMKFLEIDISRKNVLARKFNVTLTEERPAQLVAATSVHLERGR